MILCLQSDILENSNVLVGFHIKAARAKTDLLITAIAIDQGDRVEQFDLIADDNFVFRIHHYLRRDCNAGGTVG